jgi:hypothetical protein
LTCASEGFVSVELTGTSSPVRGPSRRRLTGTQPLV